MLTIIVDAGIEPDVDDSSKLVTTLTMLGESVDALQLCETFEAETHFRVYSNERDPSFSANCNVLAALLHQRHIELFATQIVKVANFLCDRMWNADEEINDKWVSRQQITLLKANATFRIQVTSTRPTSMRRS